MLKRLTASLAVFALASAVVPSAQAAASRSTPVKGWSLPLGPLAATEEGLRFVRTRHFEMIGARWDEGVEPRIEVRTRTRGKLSPWVELEALEGHGAHQVRATEPVWVGPSNGVQVRVEGPTTGVRLVLVDPGHRSSDLPSNDTAVSGVSTFTARAAQTSAPMPWIRHRRAWGANDRWREGTPRYEWTIKQAHIHHTAGSNRYTRADVPAIIRGMYWYHTQELGWSDIGYNFLVDKFGRIWQGRAGRLRGAVRGAHTLGFNHVSVGVAAIGSFKADRSNWPLIRSIVRLTAWKLDRWDRRPAGKIGLWSGGSDRYPKDMRVRLPVIDGHRDTNYTACPGDWLYSKLPQIRRRAQVRVDSFN